MAMNWLKTQLQQALWAEFKSPEILSEEKEDQAKAKIDIAVKDDPSVDPEGQKVEADFRPGIRFWTSLSIFMAMQLLAAIDATAIGTVMSTITADLHGSTSEGEWIGNAYLLTACVFQLPISASSEVFGRKYLVYATLGIFMLGSLVVAVAQNMRTLIAGRAIQGLGAAGSLVLPEVFVADNVPLRLRGMYYSFLLSIWAVGSAIGPVMAGGFAQYVTWRWLFYINLPICGCALVLTPLGLRLKPVPATWRQKLKQVDFIGAIIVVASTSSVILAISMGGAMYEWSSWHVLVPLLVGFAGFVASGFYEFHIPQRPIFNPRVFANLSANLCFLQNILQGIIAMAVLYYLPVLFQGALGYGALISGVAILPIDLIGPPASLLAGLIVTKTGHYQFLTWIGWALSLFGLGLLILFNTHNSVAQIIFLQVPAAIGIGMLYTTLSTSVIATNEAPEWVDAAAFMSFSRSLGDVFGTAIAGSVFASQMRTRLANIQGVTVDAGDALAVVSYLAQLPSGVVKDEIRDALVGSVHTIFFVTCGIAAVALLSNIVIKEYTLDVSSEARQGIDDE